MLQISNGISTDKFHSQIKVRQTFHLNDFFTKEPKDQFLYFPSLYRDDHGKDMRKFEALN